MAEQEPFPPLSPSMSRAWGNSLPLSGTGQLTMDIAIMSISIFVASFIAIISLAYATTIRTLRERISELEEEKKRDRKLLVEASGELHRLAGVEEAFKKERENATEIYATAAEIDRDMREELRLAESHQKWFKCEVQVRAFIMSSPSRFAQLRNAGHLDRQNWVINDGTKILFSCSEEEFTTELLNWWETTTNNNFNI